MAGGNALHVCVQRTKSSALPVTSPSASVKQRRTSDHTLARRLHTSQDASHTHTHGSILLGTSLYLLFVSYSFVLRLLHCYQSQLVFHISLLQHFSLSFSVCLSRTDFRVALPESTGRRQKKSYFIRVVNVSSRSELNVMMKSCPLIWLHKTQTDS